MRAGQAIRRFDEQSQSSESLVEPSIAPPWIIDEVVKLQYSSDDSIRINAAQRLRDACPGIAEYSPFFVGTLALLLHNDKNKIVRKAAGESFVALGSSSARLHAHTLEIALRKDSDADVRQTCVRALALAGGDVSDFSQARTLGRVALNDSDLAVRREAAKALALVVGPAVEAERQVLVDVLTNGKNNVLRSRAAFALGFAGIGSDKYSEALAKAALNDKAAGVRSSAAHAMECLGDSASCGLSHLVTALEDGDASLRKAAAMALGAIGCPDREEVEVVEKEEPKVTSKKKSTKKGTKSNSQLQLPDLDEKGSELESAKVSQKPKKKRTHSKFNKMQSALLEPKDQPSPPNEAMLAVQSRASAALAATCLRDSNAFVRYRAAEAMSAFGNTMNVRLQKMAETALQDESAEARHRASEALGTLGDCRALHARTFSNLVVDSDPIMQRRAVDALRDLGTAARPHRKVLNTVMRQSADESLRMAARQTCNFLETRPLGELGRRIVSPNQSLRVDLQNSMANLRTLVADSVIEARCSTPAVQRSEARLLLQAKLLA